MGTGQLQVDSVIMLVKLGAVSHVVEPVHVRGVIRTGSATVAAERFSLQVTDRVQRDHRCRHAVPASGQRRRADVMPSRASSSRWCAAGVADRLSHYDTHTLLSLGMRSRVQIMSIAASVTRAQPCEAGWAGTLG